MDRTVCFVERESVENSWKIRQINKKSNQLAFSLILTNISVLGLTAMTLMMWKKIKKEENKEK